MTYNSTPVRSIPCNGYPFSNDSWSGEQAARLHELLSGQTDRERAVGLVIGSGGLPYVLGSLGVSRITVLDRHPQVIESVRGRVELLDDVASWDEYAEAVETGLDERLCRSFQREYRIASLSGLRGDFATTQAAAATTEIAGHEGDAVDELPRLARQYRDEGVEVCYANVTNVGLCLEVDGDTSQRAGRRALAGLLYQLPWTDDAVIVESGPDILRAQVRTAEEHFQTLY
jgi:hypothetical protein